MNLRHLNTFVTVADAGSFARAVARLNLTQPAASRQILALEADLGVLLFDRIGRRIQLTSEGEDLLRRSRHLLAEADSLRERARALKGGQVGTLRVGGSAQSIENLLVPFLPLYRRLHPGVEVQLTEGAAVRQHGLLERGEVQLATIPEGDEMFQRRLLYPICIIAALSRTHRLGRRAVLDIAELADEPLLLLDRAYGSRGWFDSACDAAHINPRVFLESSVPQTLIALAGAGHGIAVISGNMRIPRSPVRGVPLLHRGTPLGRWAAIAWNPQRFLPPYAEQFVEELAAYVRRDYPGREFVRRAPPFPRPKEPVK